MTGTVRPQVHLADDCLKRCAVVKSQDSANFEVRRWMVLKRDPAQYRGLIAVEGVTACLMRFRASSEMHGDKRL